MSNLSSFSIINGKVENICKNENVQHKGIAFMTFCLRTLFKLSDEELEEVITDGPMDGEIDAIYINNRIINIITFKYTDRYELSQKNYPGSELDQFILTVESIISGNLDHKSINDSVWDKYQEIRTLASNGKIEFKVYVISNKEYPVDSGKVKLKNVIDRFDLKDDPIYFNQEDIVDKLLTNKSKKNDGKVTFIDTQHFEKSNGNIKTIIGTVAASDFMNLIKLNTNEINECVFNENIRVYKSNHRVNKAIIDSAKSENNYQFFYLNNGVTILCENVKYTPNTRSPLVELTNFQIINGGQTSHSLFNIFKTEPKKLDTVEVLVRICEIKSDDPISDKISESSNNQIPVGNRDLHSNDLIQLKLQEDFYTYGLFYERKPNQYEDQPKEKVFNNEILGQLYMSYYLGMPSEAKNSKSKVFSDLYDQIFNEKVLCANELIRLHKLYKPLLDRKTEIQMKKRKKENVSEKESFISRAIFHIISGTRYFFDEAFSEIDKQQLSSKEAKRLKEEIYSFKGEEFTNNAIQVISKVVENEMKLVGEKYTHDKFFKAIPTNHLLKEKILDEINYNIHNVSDYYIKDILSNK